jgi:hypothetical protein
MIKAPNTKSVTTKIGNRARTNRIGYGTSPASRTGYMKMRASRQTKTQVKRVTENHIRKKDLGPGHFGALWFMAVFVMILSLPG